MTFGALLRGSLLYTIGSVVPRIGIFLLLPIYTLGMGAGEFGVFSLMLSLANLLTIMFRLGLDGSLLRFHFEVPAARRPALYWTTAALTLLAGAVLGGLGVILVGPVFEAAFADVPFAPYGLLAIAVAAVTAFQFIPTSYFRAIERPGLVFWLGILSFGAGAIATLALVLGLHLGAAGGLIGQAVGGGVVVVATLATLARLRPASLDATLARESLEFGIPLIPHTVAGWVLNLSDRWLIGLVIGLPAAATQIAIGVYSLGYQLGQLVTLVGVALNLAWMPFFYSRGGKSDGPAILREMTSLSVGALAILTVASGVLAPEAVRILAPRSWGPEAIQAATVTPLVAFAGLVQGLYFMVSSPVFLQRRTKALPLLTIAAGAANVGLNLVLIPIPGIGIVGAAFSTIAGYSVMLALTLWYASRTYPLRLDWGRLGLLFAGVVATVLVGRSIAPLGLAVAILAHAALAGVFALGAALVLRAPWRKATHLIRHPSEP